MAFLAVVEGFMISLWAFLTWGEGSYEIIQKLKNKNESFNARVQDIVRESLSSKIQRGKKRKREDDLQDWVTESRKLGDESEHVLRVVEEDRNFLTCAKMRKIAEKKFEALTNHEVKGDILLRHVLVDRKGPRRGAYIPVKELIGQVASTTLGTLQALLQDDKVGRVAIHGMEGIGKTFLMKHLHNRVLKWVERFDYVFWATLSDQFNVKHVQDAIAAAVSCDLSDTDDLFLRAKELSHALTGLGRFVLFLDAVPESRFSLEEVGIPVPSEGSTCKLVLTTSSALVCGVLDCVGEVKLGPLSEAEACQLFMHEARINMESVSMINEIASLLAKGCYGVPRMIVDVAKLVCGIDDIHEWKYVLFESEYLVKEAKLSVQFSIDELECGSQVVNSEAVIHSLPYFCE